MSSRLLKSLPTSFVKSNGRVFARRAASTQAPPYPGATAPFTQKLEFIKGHEAMPIYSVMDLDGNVTNTKDDPKLDDATLVRSFETMTRLNVIDNILYEAQRQGRISFYMTNYGEEAVQVASCEALDPVDEVFAQYREAGVLMHRGFTVEQMIHQCLGTRQDPGKGRQMPVHYGSPSLHFQMISSPLATQLPQATGAAYTMKLAKQQNCVICYFGDGAASEGDFHAALNFAATLECPVIFFCRNNGFAISTPTSDQYRGDGIIGRGLGYGMHSIRVDGNDFLAVYNATKAAREMAIKDNTPVLIEAMTYRVGHHSTSDDSTKYRSKEEIEYWRTQMNPIARFRKYIEQRGLWSDEKQKAVADQTRSLVLSTLDQAEKAEPPTTESLFDDVYDQLPWNLKEQKAKLIEHLNKYPDSYKLGHH